MVLTWEDNNLQIWEHIGIIKWPLFKVMALVLASIVFYKIITAILAEMHCLGPEWDKFNPKVIKLSFSIINGYI